MSRRTKQPATSRRSRRADHPQPAQATSRRTRRDELPQPAAAFAFAENPRIVSNPIFYCDSGPSQPKPPPVQLRCVYGPGSVSALVHDPVATAPAGGGGGAGKPLSLPPCRAHHAGPAGSHVPAAVVASGPHGRVLRRAPQDPFLAAYVECSKSAGDNGGGQVKRQREKRKTTRKCKEGDIVRGCGIWNGWAAGAMSCRYGCAVAAQGDAPAATAKAEAEAEAPTGPTLDLSWAPAVLSARALERRREQR